MNERGDQPVSIVHQLGPLFFVERNCSLPLTAYFFTLPMIVVPILLILPPSRQWWRQEGWFKLLWYLIWLFFVVGFILASGVEIMPKCASDTIVHIVRSWRCSRASSLHKLMSERPDAKRIFSHAKSSTEVFSRFIAADVAAGRTPDRLLKSALVEGVCQWCIAVDVPEDVDDDFPVVFPADIDPANLPTEWDEKGGGKEIPSEGQKMENCEDLALVVCKGGNATYRSRKSLIPRNFYNMPTGRINRAVFYLTPHGKKALGGNLAK